MTRVMVKVVTNNTNLTKGWIYPMVREGNWFMLDCNAVSISVGINDIRRVNMPYQTILAHAQ